MAAARHLLVVNAGSSSLKFGVYDIAGATDDPVPALRGQIAGIGTVPRIIAADGDGHPVDLAADDGRRLRDHDDALALLFDGLATHGHADRLAGVGHRVVHGGTAFTAPMVVDAAVIDALAALVPLAPLHQPHNLAAIRALALRRADLKQIACFDTAFHAGQPAEARRVGLPRAYAERGIQRYGFHGLSYESVAGRLAGMLGGALPSRTVIAHLGNGASLCAVRDGRGIATTMGFSTLDGLPMGTRCGSLDPGVILHLMREDGITLADLEQLLYHRSGLLGISGITSDMRALLASDAPAAAEAVRHYCYRVGRELGSSAAALQGLDCLVFTGGIGENAPEIRAAVCRDAAWLGLTLDDAANARGGPLISRPDGRVAAWVIATDEERVIARHTRRLLGL